MKTKTISLIGITAGLVLASTSAMAHGQTGQSAFRPLQQPKLMKKYFKRLHHPRRVPVTATWHRALNVNKQLSSNDARTLTQAALILYGNKNSKIVAIKPAKNKRGRDVYHIQIQNPQTNSTQQLIMNAANGRMRIAK